MAKRQRKTKHGGKRMNDNLASPPPSQEEKNPRLGIWTGLVGSIVYLIFFGFSIYIVIQQGYF